MTVEILVFFLMKHIRLCMIYNSILEHIGNTPLLKIDPTVHGLTNVTLYAKLELFNPFGSVKDRIAWNMIKDHADEIMRDHKTILEMSSGNTAKALQMIAGTLGVPFKTITNRIRIPEVRDILHLTGAIIEELPGTSDCHDPADPNDPMMYIHREALRIPGGSFVPSQYDNPDNTAAHYAGTGTEIARDLGSVDYLFGGLGTSGSTRGIRQRLIEINPDIKTVGVVAERGDYIPGIRDRNELQDVGIFDSSLYQDIVPASSRDAIDGMLKLIRRVGIMAGPTSGAVFSSLCAYLQERKHTFKRPQSVVFVVCDRAEWYISYVKERYPAVFGSFATDKKVWQRYSKTVLDSVPTIAPLELSVSLDSFLVIDTRSPLAFRLQHIPESLNMPEAILEDLITSPSPLPKNRPLVLVCPRGEKTIPFAAYLRERGYDARSLEGGIVGWRDSGGMLKKI